MLGLIGIEDLEVICVIGAYEHERAITQKLHIDISVEADMSAPSHTDDLKAALNYEELANDIQRIGVTGQFNLIETYANAIIESLMAKYPITWMEVKIKKPSALKQARHAFVKLEKFKALKPSEEMAYGVHSHNRRR
jgi:dihydroneopterin aldolase